MVDGVQIVVCNSEAWRDGTWEFVFGGYSCGLVVLFVDTVHHRQTGIGGIRRRVNREC